MTTWYKIMFDHLKTMEEKYAALVYYIAMDYHELSHDKIAWQRDDWKKMARELVDEQAKLDNV